MHNYFKVVFYSEDDEGFIAIAPELPGCSAFGDTEEEALVELRIAIDLHLEVQLAEGRKDITVKDISEHSVYISARGEREKSLAYEKNDAFACPSYK